LLTTIFLQVELIFILKKQSSSTKHNNKCTWILLMARRL
jgi:hypothetical protein